MADMIITMLKGENQKMKYELSADALDLLSWLKCWAEEVLPNMANYDFYQVKHLISDYTLNCFV